MWFADDATAGGTLTGLRRWWDRLVERGPMYGYHPNSAKTCLVVKGDRLEKAKEDFHGTGISITDEGKHHLGAAIGTNVFAERYVLKKVSEWVNMIEWLLKFAHLQPHAAFTHGLMSKWNYLMRTVPNIGDLLKPLEDSRGNKTEISHFSHGSEYLQ